MDITLKFAEAILLLDVRSYDCKTIVEARHQLLSSAYPPHLVPQIERGGGDLVVLA